MTDTMTEPTLTRLPAGYEDALAAAVDRVFEERGLSFDALPAHLSMVPAGTSIEAAIAGAELMGLPLTPQGVTVAGVLEAKSDERDRLTDQALPLYPECVVELGRRSTKTTVIQMVLLGRCATRPNYRVVSTAQDGTRASQFFMNMVRMVEAELRRRGLEWADVGMRPPYRSQGREYLEWLNGSRWWVVKPEAGAFRGEAADVMWFDEAGELDATKSEDLVAGALPLMDTRPLGQIIISGTPAMVRAGIFWDYLEAGRAGNPGTGIVDYRALEYEDPSDEAVWWRVHAGLASGLTTVEKLRRSFERMPVAQFAREYLCIWPLDQTVSALDQQKFKAGMLPLEAAPDGPPAGAAWAVAFDCHIDGLYGSIVAGWYDAGVAKLQVMEHRAGTGWMGRVLAQLLAAHRDVPVAYDPIGQNQVVVQQLGSMPRVNTRMLRPMTLRELAGGAALVAAAVDDQALEWTESKSLLLAVESVTWRYSGDQRLFGRKNAAADVSSIVAGSESLFIASGLKPKTKRRIISAALD